MRDFRYLIKTILACLILIAFAGTASLHSYAKEKPDHDKDIQKVLFGKENWSSSQSAEVKTKVDMIEKATAIALDQHKGSHKQMLASLRRNKIYGLPNGISSFDFSVRDPHRSFTHRGWDFHYQRDIAHWADIRKYIMLNTFNKEMEFSNPWITSISKNYDPRCEALCELVYYVHVLGDHVEDSNHDGFSDYKVKELKIAVGDTHDKPNSIIDQLIDNVFPVLFRDQKNSLVYGQLKRDLQSIDDEATRLLTRDGGLNSNEKLKQYDDCAQQVLDTMAISVPGLLRNEDYFHKIFY